MTITVEHPYKAINPTLASRIASELQTLFPITSDDGKWILRAKDISVATDRFDAENLKLHQMARQEASSRTVPISASLELVHEGKVVDRRKGKIGDLPLMGVLGSFVVNGNDYFVPMAQQRRKPGAYTREKANGLFETQVNIPRLGMFRIEFDPQRGILKFVFGDTRVDWFGIVKALGATDDEIRQAVGVDMFKLNEKASYEKDVDRLYEAMFERSKVNKDLVRAGILSSAGRKAVSQAEKLTAIKQLLSEDRLDPFVTSRTLKSPFTSISKDMLLASASRLLQVQRREEAPDDLDAPEFKTAEGVEDLMPERIRGRIGRTLVYSLKRLLGRETDLSKMVTPTWANPITVGYFGGYKGFEGGLAHTAEIANPLAILSERSKLTVRGSGGIQDDRAITDSARLFRPGAAGFIDLLHTPEGADIGVTTHAAANVVKTGKTLSTIMFPVKKGVVDWKHGKYITVEEASDLTIGYPEYWSRETGKALEPLVRVNRNGKIDEAQPTEVDYILPSGGAMFDHTSNAALFLDSTHAVRGMMAGKHLTQALPLVNRELPLPTMKTYGGEEVMQVLGNAFTVVSKVDGVVESVKPDCIIVAGQKHWLFDHYPMQAKVGLHHIPLVKVGDKVKKGQVLADNNYSRDGKLALGVNLRSAYTPWRNGGVFEDAITVSESAAKDKLASEHIHRETLWLDSDVKVDQKLFFAQFPTQLTAENKAKLDDQGVIKVGSEVVPHDVLVAAVRKKDIDPRDKTAKGLGNIHKMLLRPYSNAALVWDEDFKGTVLRVVKLSDRIEVHLKTNEPLRVGDKLSMSSAAKGTVAAIIPDAEMPQDEKGRPLEIIMNPIGVLGRINPSQTLEQAAGKLVRDGKEKYDFSNFDGRYHAKELKQRLAAKGLKHKEYLFDPVTGRKTERPVAVGYNYVMKLDHPVRKKFSVRGRDGYTMNEAPTSGKGKGGQSFDQLTVYSLLGMDANAILGESVGIRGTKNDDFWEAYQAGEQPPPPKVPFAFEKLHSYLNAMGIDTSKRGNVLHYMPMTDKKVLEMSNGEIKNARQVRAQNLAAEKGGLFDEEVTGGVFGDQWGHIPLNRAMPHPLYEPVVRELCGLTQAEFYGLLGETMHLDPKTGKVVMGHDGLTGEAAFRKLLSFDPATKMRETKERLKTAVGSDANKLHRITQYLRGLQKTGLKAPDAYMTSVIPVVPPKYRSIIELPTGALQVADANLLYRDVILTRDLLQQAEKDRSLPPAELGKARVTLYDSIAGLVGVGKPLTERRDEELKGFGQVIKGKTNKTGLFQSQLGRRRNDYTGRSTIEPDASLGPDEIGIPSEMAWVMFEPIVVRHMVRGGWEPKEAMNQIRQRTMAARNALDAVMKDHPVIYNRAPSLHRWSAGAAMPKIVSGRELRISPLVVGPYNADYDGDTMSVHPPITEAARREAFNLLPSQNLLYDKDRSLAYSVDKDIIAGVFALTRPGRPSAASFETAAEAIKAYQDNKNSLQMNSIVRVKDRQGQWTIGQLIFFSLVPAQFSAGLTMPIDGKKLEALLTRVAKEAPAQFNNISRKLAQAGFEAAARSGGITTSVEDLIIDKTKATRLLKNFEQELRRANTYKEKQRLAISLYDEKYKPEIDQIVKEHFTGNEEGYATLIGSGAAKSKGNDNLRQFLVSPGLVRDVHDQVVPAVITSAYGSGMKPSDYLLTSPGARAGQVARSMMTAKPGYLAKEIAASVGNIRVMEADCKTLKGIELSLNEPDVDLLDRHLAQGIPGTNYKRNDVVTPEILAKMRDSKKDRVFVRSPMTCEADSPPCQMCAGRRADGKLHPIGANIGYNYGQAVSERSTQLVLRSFHSGGTYGSGHSLQGGFARLQELLNSPEILHDQGTLADVSGTVTSVQPAPQGGYHVMVGTTDHYVYPARQVKVKVGQQVHAGDPLSDGAFRPQDVAQHKGLLAAQQYVVDEARKAYTQAGATVRKPVLEVLVAGNLRYVTITDDGGERDLAVGDVIHENEYNRRKMTNPKIKAKPAVLGLGSKPLKTSTDLLERLNFEELLGSLRHIPAIGGQSDLTGARSPIPGIAYGAAFRPAAPGK